MSKPVILLSSVTYAIRAQKLLDQKGIRTTMKKVSHSVHTRGCGYGLEVKGELDVALEILSTSGIRVVNVINRDSNGN